jgi:hypothetical protein
MRSRGRRLYPLALLGWLAAQPLVAQVDRATLNGTVTDPSGAVIVGAKVDAISAATGKEREVLTNAQGIYVIPALPAGIYTFTFSRGGFETAHFEGVELRIGQTLTLDAQLKVGNPTAHVEVKGTAPLLERNSAELGEVVGGAQIADLPVNGRNWANLLVLAPGAIDDGGGNQRTIRFGGRGRDDNNYKFDGVDATGIQEQAQKSTTRLQVSEDAVEEYRVNSMLYTAEYGAGAGGQVDIVTKTGTNEWHGDLFEFLRNSALDSRSFLDLDNDPTQTGPTRIPPFRLNQFGGSIGGPIVKDKTFIFLNYEGIRQFRGQTLHAFVPSASFRTLALGAHPELTPIFAAYPAGQISTCVFGDNPGGTCDQIDEFTHLGSIRIREDSGLMRFDHRFNDRTTFYLRAVRDDSFTTGPLNNVYDQQQIKTKPANYVMALQHTFSANIFNEAKFGINRAPFHNPQVGAFPYDQAISFGDFEGLNNDNTDNEVGTTFNWIDNLTILRGRHTFKMGGEFRRVRLNQGITEDDAVKFSDEAAILANQVDNFLLKSSWWSRGLRHTFVMPYFQDQWKVRPNLTFNMGLRWEYYAPITEAHGRSRIFDIQRCANAVPSDPGTCPKGSAFFFPNYRNFDPRFAVAWSPGALGGKTVIRAGFGIYHGAGQNDDLNAGLESDNVRISLSSSDVPGGLSYPIEPFIPLALTQGRTPRALQRDRRDLYAEEWGLSIQHNLPHDWLFQTGYTGSSGIRLFARTYINTCDNTLAERAEGICTRPLPGVDIVDLKRNDGNSTFHSLQVALQRRFASGFEFGSQYLWSHSINDGSIGGGESNAPDNVLCRRCDRGPSVFDVRHNLVVHTVYDLPFGPEKPHLNSGWAGKLLGGWNLGSMGVFHTGHPITVLFSPDGSFLPDGNDRSNQRPDLVPGVPVVPANQGANNWINPAAFQSPPTDANGNLLRFGNAGRGLVRAPNTWQIDLALTKRTKISERLTLEFRAEAFNVFNRNQLADPSSITLNFNPACNDPNANCAVNFGTPVPTPVSTVTPPGGFGIISSIANFNSNNDSFAPDNVGSGTPRQIQFGLKLIF